MRSVGAVISYRISPYTRYNCNQFRWLQGLICANSLKTWSYRSTKPVTWRWEAK